MIYFLSDAHLGSRIIPDRRAHEKKLVSWLELVRKDATAIYLLGDMFDFWFEYKTVVPKGYVRFLGKLAELTDEGIEIHFFIGNHDIWTFGYLQNETGLIVHNQPEVIEINKHRFFMAHGDGLSTEKKGFTIIRKLFHSRTAQILFGMVPPRLGQEFGFKWSESNRLKIKHIENNFQGEDNEHLVVFAKKYFELNPETDFCIFGHRHIALDLQVVNQKRVIILGDFVSIFSYGVFDGENFWLDYLD